MRLKWFPWRFLVGRYARSQGFLDPFPWLARMRGFAQPSEISEPVELLRAGVLFHARGLINTRAIQHNLDWVWPYWVERQFNPADASFIPRAFSFSHINLTHRNWTAVGLPGIPFYSIVDPRGLVTPFHDSWSLDFWLAGADQNILQPSKLEQAEQWLDTRGNLVVHSRFEQNGFRLATEVFMECDGQSPDCIVRVTAASPPKTSLMVAIRPYNPEGISFIDSIKIENSTQWIVNNAARVRFSQQPDKCLFSTYREGDVSQSLDSAKESTGASCPASMATGAALFSISELDEALEVRVSVSDENTGRPVIEGWSEKTKINPASNPSQTWKEEISKCAKLQIPDPPLQKLYDTAVASIILHSPGEVFPGPYTYKRFWYRDAAFILNALLTLGSCERAKLALDLFPRGQTAQGYFRSQEGEWDSNGEVLWIMHRYLELTGSSLPWEWKIPVERGANWILKKRLPKTPPSPHAGLLPAGFSAEHLGPNDFYYWDNFWGVAGLRCAAQMLKQAVPGASGTFSTAADDFWESIIASFKHIPTRRFKGALSASPYRRMDAGAIGSLVADYPLQLFAPGDERLLKTTNYLLTHSSFGGGFFQNMIHSGINAYLTLHLAQVLLRAGDVRALELVDVVARLASPTGQWPEAIHPHTGGGCMGDGQHIWASAEWAMILRNLFVREEGGKLVLGAGIFPRWLDKCQPLMFGPTLTPFGQVSVQLKPESRDQFTLTLEADWRGAPPEIEACVPGCSIISKTDSLARFIFKRNA